MYMRQICFLFASKSETQGIVLAEAMAAGTPVVAVHAVGSDDIVKDGVNGFLDRRRGKQVGGESHRSSTAGEPV